jgi:hypothetical protein
MTPRVVRPRDRRVNRARTAQRHRSRRRGGGGSGVSAAPCRPRDRVSSTCVRWTAAALDETSLLARAEAG